MEMTYDEKTFLRKKYGFNQDNFIKVQKLIDNGFSIMKAAKIVAAKKNNGEKRNR